MDKGKVHDVVLVGGSTRIPKVQAMLQVRLGGPGGWGGAVICGIFACAGGLAVLSCRR